MASLRSLRCLRLRLLSKPGLWLIMSLNTGNDWSLVRNITRIAIQAALERWQKAPWRISFWGSFGQLTSVGVGLSVQESGVRNWDFLHLAAPLAVGNAARFGTGVAWSFCCLKNGHPMQCTCVTHCTGVNDSRVTLGEPKVYFLWQTWDFVPTRGRGRSDRIPIFL